MPTYQYACTSDSCGIEFERVQAFTDPALTECPECTGRVRKVYGSVGVVFKGSGFYRTDSRDAKTNGAGKADSSSASGDSGSSSGSSSSSDSGSSSSASTATPKSGGTQTKSATAAAS